MPENFAMRVVDSTDWLHEAIDRDGPEALQHSQFTCSNMAQLDLRGFDLTGSDLRSANLTGADLRGTNLVDVQVNEFTNLADVVSDKTTKGLQSAQQRVAAAKRKRPAADGKPTPAQMAVARKLGADLAG